MVGVWQQRFDALDALVSSDTPEQRAGAMLASETDTHQETP